MKVLEKIKNLVKKVNKRTSEIALGAALVASPLVASADAQEIITKGIDSLAKLVMAIGAGFLVWGIVNLAEGYGSDNPGAKSQGIKQMMAGGGIVLIGLGVVPLLSQVFS